LSMKVPRRCVLQVTTIKARAPAKVNLTLHVTGQRGDGYHLLDSLVVFADIADQLTAAPAPDLTLTVAGPFARGVPVDHTNLMMRAAQTLRAATGVTAGAALTLEKNLPHAAGIGSGSSDAAATIAMLAKLWGVAPLSAAAAEILALGADVPVCMHAPNPVRMSGIGEVLTAVPTLPAFALVLLRPPVDVPTGAVFDGLATKNGTPMSPLPDLPDFEGFVRWLGAQRNDLQPPAQALAPQITATIAALQVLPEVAFAGMSGSGATCFAVVRDLNAAARISGQMQTAHPDWWIAAARVL
jgi:4-diphosphocytidyl-2-C-methyl-D-erythritol kinase